ncbi:hypothetical protein [Caballeronia sordidicola]|uniref:Uncharacterized protein n=1 Tax=Caballeronia sordidicola TaxID=196367 RepID=A0A226X576_CABSO|nr:hypothetical protein [Caballeronia sordidicola]OXC78635.1 hypothetical protein BSU04_10925 [Caballeronia sordidicola]
MEQARRKVIIGSLAILGNSAMQSTGLGIASMLAACGGGGGGGGNNETSTPTLNISSVSSSTPTALTPISLSTTGLNIAAAFTVTLLNSSGYNATINPIRTASDGTVIISVPLYIDPATGKTSPLSASVQITQGSLSSNPVPLSIADIPTTASYGVTAGEISRAFFNAQEIYLGITVNSLQAMRSLKTSKTNTATVQQHIAAQQINIIEARSNIDLIVSGSQSSLRVGTTKDGAAIAFDANSVDIMDRTIAMYLQSIGYLPTTIYSSVVADANAARTPSASSKNLVPVKRPVTPKSVIDGLGLYNGSLSLTNSAIQAAGAKNSTDNFIAIGQGISTAALILGAVVASPELIAAATIVGTGYAITAIANDGYKWYTASNAIDAANGDPAKLAVAQSQLNDAQANFAVDTFGAMLGVFGFPSEVASDVGLGAQVVTALTAAQQQAVPGLAVQGLTLINGIAGLVVAANGAEATADGQTMNSSNAEIPPAADSFGFADGAMTIANPNAPILWPLTGVSLTDPGTSSNFTTLADTSGDYSLLVPIGVPGFDYPQMSIVPYDPVSGEQLSSPQTVNLSTLSPAAPVNISPHSGVCNDTDASDPDSDDPDCD